MLVGRQFPNNGKSDLHVVDFRGKVNPIVDCKAIGKADSYANPVITLMESRYEYEVICKCELLFNQIYRNQKSGTISRRRTLGAIPERWQGSRYRTDT